MIPKRTTKLRAGDYCLISRSDRLSVAFTYLGPVPGSQVSFYGALLHPAFRAEAGSPLPEALYIDSSAMVHVKCYAENNTPIIGNAAELIGSAAIAAALAACTDMRVGAVHKVWGHLTLLKRAERAPA